MHTSTISPRQICHMSRYPCTQSSSWPRRHMVVTKKGKHDPTNFGITKWKLGMPFRLGLLTPIGQSQEICQRILLLSQVGVLKENTSPMTNSWWLLCFYMIDSISLLPHQIKAKGPSITGSWLLSLESKLCVTSNCVSSIQSPCHIDIGSEGGQWGKERIVWTNH